MVIITSLVIFLINCNLREGLCLWRPLCLVFPITPPPQFIYLFYIYFFDLGRVMWWKETNYFTSNIQSVYTSRLAACLGSQKIGTVSCAMGQPAQMGRRTYPINTLPGNPSHVTCWLPWHALRVSAALNMWPAPI